MPTFTGNDRRNTIEGSVAGDLIQGLGNKDQLNGNQGPDTIEGGAGNDTIRGGGGNDQLFGGAGNDRIIPGPNFGDDLIGPSRGNDRIDFTGADENSFYSVDFRAPFEPLGGDFETVASVDVTVRNTSARVTKTFSDGSTGTDRWLNLDAISDAVERIPFNGEMGFSGTNGNDLITFDRDTGPSVNITPSGGDDTISGSLSTFERLTLTRNGDQAMDVTITQSENGQMAGVAVLEPEGGGPTIRYTFSGIDVIRGSTADELIIGSDGDDTFRPNRGNDGFDAGDGRDTIVYISNAVTGLLVDLNQGGATYRHTADDTRYEDGLRSVENAVGTLVNDDILKGSEFANVLYGLGGEDKLVGRRGNDTLIGGTGDDTVSGGNGRDTFVFAANDGDDRLRGFEDGRDTIQVTAPDVDFGDVEISDLGRHALVTFAETSVKVLNTDHNLLTAADFDFVG